MFDFIITLLPGSAGWTHLSKTMITVLQWSRRVMFMLSPSLSPLPKFQRPRISESKVFPCFQCVSSDPKSHNIRHFWKRLWILTRALVQNNAGVNFRILTKMFYQNICLICSLLQHLYRPKWTAPSRNPNGLLHPEVLYMNTSSLRIS